MYYINYYLLFYIFDIKLLSLDRARRVQYFLQFDLQLNPKFWKVMIDRSSKKMIFLRVHFFTKLTNQMIRIHHFVVAILCYIKVII